MAGYPEKLSKEESRPALLDDSKDKPDGDGRVVGANSSVLYNPDGECIGEYRKTNLYDTDKTWAKPGFVIRCSVIDCISLMLHRDWLCHL